MSEELSRIYGERFAINVAEWRIIATLGEFDMMTATQISTHARMSKVKVSRGVTSLANRKLVARKTNATDRREEFLVLTAKGRETYAEIVPLALSYEKSMIDRLSPADLSAFERILTELTG